MSYSLSPSRNRLATCPSTSVRTVAATGPVAPLIYVVVSAVLGAIFVATASVR